MQGNVLTICSLMQCFGGLLLETKVNFLNRIETMTFINNQNTTMQFFSFGNNRLNEMRLRVDMKSQRATYCGQVNARCSTMATANNVYNNVTMWSDVVAAL